MIGKIHSIESMGLVDGPGIRTVVFFQGCKLRCLYCHNPDTWKIGIGKDYTPEELVKKIIRYKPYFSRSNGGVTFSGGEPLLQDDFLLEVLKLCKENDIHTTIDTAGFGNGNYDEILKYTDLILFDIKHITDEGYESLVGQKITESLKFLKAVQQFNIPLWIRQVVIPNINDNDEYIKKLANAINNITNVERIELLPYHVLGVNKYEKLGISYKLKDVEPLNKNTLYHLETLLEENLKDCYKNLLYKKG